MLLVLTLVVTTLMGVMVTDVSAVSMNRDANTKEITLEFGGATLPSKLGAYNKFSVGNWTVWGYNYDAAAVKEWIAAGATGTIAGTPTTKHNFLETDIVANPLDRVTGEMTKYDFKAGSFIDGTRALYNGLTSAERKVVFTYKTDGSISSNYSRISVFPQKMKGDAKDSSYSWKTIPLADMKATSADNTAYKFTFYAYTENRTTGSVGGQVDFELRNFSGGNVGLPIKSACLVSNEGIPHKVDIVLTADANGNSFAHFYVDGTQVQSSEMSAGGAEATAAVDFQPRFALSPSSSALTVAETDWYITQFGAQTGFTAISRDELSKELIVVPNYESLDRSTTYRTDDFVVGVDSDTDAAITKGLKVSGAGTRKANVYESKYNNPASMFTGETTNVKLVDRTTGAEVAPADATGTMDNYYFMVNGIYVLPAKVADPLPYYKSAVDPFAVSADRHQTTNTRVHYENYEDNVMDENLPAVGGLRSGFLKFTSDPRGTFSFYNGNIKYGTNDGYYTLSAPQVKLADAEGYDKKLTLQFDIYMPEFVSSDDNSAKFTFGGHIDPAETKTNSSGYGKAFENVFIITNGLKDGNFSPKYALDIVGDAWNTITLVFDSTDTADDGKYDISMYVNGQLQAIYETGGHYKANAAERLCSLHLSRLYMPLYTSVAIMNDGWYVGDYNQFATPVASGTIDADKVEGVEVQIDDANNLISYDNTSDTDYSALVAAMEAAGYQPVYTQVVDVDMINEKYDEVDGLIENVVNEDGTRTVTAKLVKKWMDNSGTNKDIVAEIDENGFSTYTIKDANITAAVDNGDGTASITIKSAFSETASFQGIASTYEDIIAALAAETPAREGRKLELTGFAVVESGKLPKVYTLPESGLTLRDVTYNTEAGQAELIYRKYGVVEDVITFQFVVAAYDANGKMLAIKPSSVITLDAELAGGENTITFAPEFAAEVNEAAATYKVFMFNSVVDSVPVFRSAKVVK